MNKNLEKLFATIFATTFLCPSIGYCMESEEEDPYAPRHLDSESENDTERRNSDDCEEEEETENEEEEKKRKEEEERERKRKEEEERRFGPYWPSAVYIFPKEEKLNKSVIEPMEERGTELRKKWGLVYENGERKNPYFHGLLKKMEAHNKFLAEDINVLNKDAAIGGFNACVCHAINNVNTAREQGYVAFEMSIPQHSVCVVIMNDAKPVVIDSYHTCKNDVYKYNKFDLIDYIKKVNSDSKYMWGQGHTSVNGSYTKNANSRRSSVMQVNLALRMIVLFRLKAYIKDKNDIQALSDAKKLANYICEMEKTDFCALWPACYASKNSKTEYSNSKRHYILFPPYEYLKKLLDEARYDEYIATELPEHYYFELHDVAKFQEEDGPYSFYGIIDHFRDNEQYLFCVDYYTVVDDSNSHKFKSYQDYYNHIKQTDKRLFYYNYDVKKGSYIRHTKALWSKWDENTRLEERFNNKKMIATEKNFKDEIQTHLLKKTLNNAYGNHEKYLKEEVGKLTKQINDKISFVYNPDIESL